MNKIQGLKAVNDLCKTNIKETLLNNFEGTILFISSMNEEAETEIWLEYKSDFNTSFVNNEKEGEIIHKIEVKFLKEWQLDAECLLEQLEYENLENSYKEYLNENDLEIGEVDVSDIRKFIENKNLTYIYDILNQLEKDVMIRNILCFELLDILNEAGIEPEKIYMIN